MKEAFLRQKVGCKVIKGVWEIKEEIMMRGPVVSCDFVLKEEFVRAGAVMAGEERDSGNSNSAARETEKWMGMMKQFVGKKHPVLIIGWKLTQFGEVWLVQLQHFCKKGNNGRMQVAFGQFGIDTECIAPSNSLENIAWQDGPYLDLDLERTPEWKKVKGLMRVSITNDELQVLGEILGDGGLGFVAAEKQKIRFTLRDKNMKSHSRSCCLRDIMWGKEKMKWRLTVDFSKD